MAKTLHTDALQEKYGPIHAIIVKHDVPGRIREAKLVDAAGIVRTYALTFLNYDFQNDHLRRIDAEIKAGGLIGETFRQHGYAVERTEIARFTASLPVWMQKDFAVTQQSARASLIGFSVKKGSGRPLPYGTIFEIYSPDFEAPHVTSEEATPDHAAQFLFKRALDYLKERAV